MDVRSSSVVWQKMELIETIQGHQKIPEWLSTHPSHENRAEHLDRLIPEVGCWFVFNEISQQCCLICIPPIYNQEMQGNMWVDPLFVSITKITCSFYSSIHGFFEIHTELHF